ncbi:DUF4238 domain-containing protein [Mucilaginibacter flavidus]|uniref:DUF4238 domain-containing protein n=1 Tax=Mucilaginibacter flavidus TaxID=2949309 RepID=UPI002093BB1E|nr:DUF4238 domain-containing protein [Mucilaginibacter flavidus]MCO5948562.1 DUF4238 domain-containing protein [Mucilaginibacter flavidus]
MDQHFLPACYLDQFCLKEGKFYRIDCSLLKKGKKPYPLEVVPAAICYGRDFYALTDEFKKLYPAFKDYDRLFLEERFYRYENVYPAIIGKIKKGIPVLTAAEAELLLFALIDFKLRNDYVRKKNEQLRRDVVDKVFRETKETPLLQQVAASMKEEILSDPQFAKHSHLATMMGREAAGSAIQEKFVRTMMRYKFTLMVSYGEFITSDNPGWTVSEDNRVHNIKFDENFHFLMPLTPMHCLSISHNDPDPAYESDPSKKKLYPVIADQEMIGDINRLSIDHFTNYLFAADKATAERIAGEVKLKTPLA